MMMKKTAISLALAAAIGLSVSSAESAVVTASWNGLFTMVNPTGTGAGFMNTSYPYYGDPTWGYGLRTQISGTFTYDTVTGTGSATIAGFYWGNAGPWQFHDIALHSEGNGSGGPGNLIQADFLFDWNGNLNLPGSIIWDASGFLNAGPYSAGQSIANTGALPASDGIIHSGGSNYPIGPSPFATTTYNSANPLVDDGIAGIAFTDTNNPWLHFNPNVDITGISVVSAVPVPAAGWLLGSGLLALLGTGRRKVSV